VQCRDGALNDVVDGKPFDGKPFDGKPFDGKPFDGKPFDGKPDAQHVQDAKLARLVDLPLCGPRR
jgi:hypothetical protein